jgi:ATP-binding cassette subfamily B protein
MWSILVIDKGRIEEQGTHEELMNKEGIYKNFIAERSKAAIWKIRKKPA